MKSMKQTCILILGMHRSGTSATNGVLSFLDIFIGNDYMINHFESEIFARSSYFNIFAYKQN